MFYTFNYILTRLKNAIDSDDILDLGSEIEFNFKEEDVLLLKKMLKDVSPDNGNYPVNPLYIKCLLNYLYDSAEGD
jgi:hypothetical protein